MSLLSFPRAAILSLAFGLSALFGAQSASAQNQQNQQNQQPAWAQQRPPSNQENQNPYFTGAPPAGSRNYSLPAPAGSAAAPGHAPRLARPDPSVARAPSGAIIIGASIAPPGSIGHTVVWPAFGNPRWAYVLWNFPDGISCSIGIPNALSCPGTFWAEGHPFNLLPETIFKAESLFDAAEQLIALSESFHQSQGRFGALDETLSAARAGLPAVPEGTGSWSLDAQGRPLNTNSIPEICQGLRDLARAQTRLEVFSAESNPGACVLRVNHPASWAHARERAGFPLIPR